MQRLRQPSSNPCLSSALVQPSHLPTLRSRQTSALRNLVLVAQWLLYAFHAEAKVDRLISPALGCPHYLSKILPVSRLVRCVCPTRPDSVCSLLALTLVPLACRWQVAPFLRVFVPWVAAYTRDPQRCPSCHAKAQSHELSPDPIQRD